MYTHKYIFYNYDKHYYIIYASAKIYSMYIYLNI